MIELISLARREFSKAPMDELSESEIGLESGLRGDFRGKPGKRQVTVLSQQAWQSACNDLGVVLPWLIRRANLLISGYEFSAADLGQVISIGDVSLKITRETDPCERMDAQHLGLYTALLPHWRGGVCCQVISGGTVSVGNKVEVSD